VVAEAAGGAILDARLPDRAQPPASVLKAITAAYALDRLGPARRFATRVLATGPVAGGVLRGDLVLAGGGDPTLQTDQLGDLVARLAATGLRAVEGRFLVWDGALPALPRISDDQPDHVGYNPAVSGLNLNFNRVHFEWRRAQGDWAVAMDARGERFVPPVRRITMRIAGREAPLFTHEMRAGGEAWTVAGGALGKGGARWLPVRAPGAYAAEVFATLAAAQGLRLPPPERVARLPEGAELARADSAPLPEVLRDMLRHSTNITAEAVGLAASGAGGLGASGRAMADWARARLGVEGRFEDHSGLSGENRMTAAAMVAALRAARPLGLVPLLRDLGQRNDEGKGIEGHPVRVLAKTGTLNFVSGLAGHILPPAGGGRELIFAIFLADLDRRAGLSRAEREDPPGGDAWARRARRLQGQLVRRWSEGWARG
jgi:D-alanyl-D-alanine carboxypeptidase/D-alanyl-D-alanine-endopeptidase (penicillin-binding protein 4)